MQARKNTINDKFFHHKNVNPNTRFQEPFSHPDFTQPNTTFGYVPQTYKLIQIFAIKSECNPNVNDHPMHASTIIQNLIPHLMVHSPNPTFSFHSPTCKFSKSSNGCMVSVCIHKDLNPNTIFIHPHFFHFQEHFDHPFPITHKIATKVANNNRSQ